MSYIEKTISLQSKMHFCKITRQNIDLLTLQYVILCNGLNADSQSVSALFASLSFIVHFQFMMYFTLKNAS